VPVCPDEHDDQDATSDSDKEDDADENACQD
jgi:hypothetical protein